MLYNREAMNPFGYIVMNNSNINNLIKSVRDHGMKDMDMYLALNAVNGSTTPELCEAANGQYQDYFYNILTEVWPWKEVIDFYNRYSNTELKEERGKTAGEMDQLKKDLIMAENAKIELENTLSETRNKYIDIICKKEAEFGKKIIYKDDVIYRLKAKLYDMEHENDITAL